VGKFGSGMAVKMSGIVAKANQHRIKAVGLSLAKASSEKVAGRIGGRPILPHSSSELFSRSAEWPLSYSKEKMQFIGEISGAAIKEALPAFSLDRIAIFSGSNDMIYANEQKVVGFLQGDEIVELREPPSARRAFGPWYDDVERSNPLLLEAKSILVAPSVNHPLLADEVSKASPQEVYEAHREIDSTVADLVGYIGGYPRAYFCESKPVSHCSNFVTLNSHYPMMWAGAGICTFFDPSENVKSGSLENVFSQVDTYTDFEDAYGPD